MGARVSKERASEGREQQNRTNHEEIRHAGCGKKQQTMSVKQDWVMAQGLQQAGGTQGRLGNWRLATCCTAVLHTRPGQNLPSICFSRLCIAAGPPIIFSMCGGSMRDICAMFCCTKGRALGRSRQQGHRVRGTGSRRRSPGGEPSRPACTTLHLRAGAPCPGTTPATNSGQDRSQLACMLRGLMSPFRFLGSFMPFIAAASGDGSQG